MSQGQDFSEEGRKEAQDEQIPVTPQARLLYQEGLSLIAKGNYEEAITCYNKALELHSEYPEALSERAYALTVLGRHKAALTSCEQALKIQPEFYSAWYRRGIVLMRLNRSKEALLSCDKALAIQPDGYEAWTTRGLVLFLSGQNQEALTNFEKALEIQPDYPKVWYNRGLVLLRLGQAGEALVSFTKALELSAECREFWYHYAWYGHGFALVRLSRYEEAITSFEKCLEIRPDHAAAALYQLVCLLLTGRIFQSITHQVRRSQFFRDLTTVFKALKYPLLFLVAFMFTVNFSQSVWVTTFKQMFSTLFSIAIIGLVIFELWKNRSGLHLVWKVYFRSGILTYIRAVCILTITLTTFAVVTPYVPQFMQVGWASLVFGSSKNIIFQPFDTIREIQPSPSVNVQPSPSKTEESLSHESVQEMQPPPEREISSENEEIQEPRPSSVTGETQSGETVPKTNFSPAQSVNYAQIFIVLFWLLLILMVPFWAKLEENIFRQGANTWKQISLKSTLFGLVHILVGIPLYSGFILIIPGFLFACRYKYVHDRYFRKTNNEQIAQEAGVEASTADHAVYNALLITLLVVIMLLTT